MAEQETPSVRKVAWSELMPWLSLVRCFRIAIQLRLLFCAALGALAMLSGWTVLGWVFSGNDRLSKEFDLEPRCPWLVLTEQIPDQPTWLQGGRGLPTAGFPGLPEQGREPRLPPTRESDAAPLWGSFPSLEPLLGVWEHLGAPWHKVFAPSPRRIDFTDRLPRLALLFFCGLWALAVWALFGGIITRAAAVELATHDRAKTGRTVRFAAAKWRAYFAAPFFPMVGVLFMGLGIALAGLLLRTQITIWLTALVWPLILLAGFFMALLLLGLLFGWPLMFANVSVEGVDSFDAVGRAYNYVFQRPLQYLFYAVVAVVLGALGWLVVWNFVAAIVGVTYGAAAWGGADIRAIATGEGDLLWFTGIWATWIRFWVEGLKMLGAGFLFSYFWTASTAIYFLLRRDADATEMDEVCPEEEEQPPQPLPAVGSDAAGAPVVEGGPEGLPENKAE